MTVAYELMGAESYGFFFLGVPVMSLRSIRSLLLVFLVAIVTAPLGGCLGLAAGGAATVATAVRQDQTVDEQIDDLATRTDLEARLLQEDPELFANVTTTVIGGRVYLKGHVDAPEARRSATRVAWITPGVKEVHNDIALGGPSGFQVSADDTWVTIKVRAELLSDARIKDVNYTIETQNRVVYLMGMAQDAAEKQLAVELARNTKGVQGVVDYLVVKDGAAYASAAPDQPVHSKDDYLAPAASPYEPAPASPYEPGTYEPSQSGGYNSEPVEVQELPGAS
jgi:osmotically-inducible protein OsmY